MKRALITLLLVLTVVGGMAIAPTAALPDQANENAQENANENASDAPVGPQDDDEEDDDEEE